MRIFTETCLRSLAAIAALFALARLMGKRQISQLTFFDYVSGISIGSIAAAMAVDPTIGYARGLAGMLVFTLFTVALYMASLKSYGARKLLEGKPIIVIQDGKILEKNLKKTRLTVNDLLEECRLKNAFLIADIAYAILETKGELSILMKPQRQPLTPQDMNLQVSGAGVCTNLVVDGTLLAGNLALLAVDGAWLAEEIAKLGISDLSGVLLCCMDQNGKLYVFEKNANVTPTPIM